MKNKPLIFNKVSVPKSKKTKSSNLTYLLDTGEDPSTRMIPETFEVKEPKKEEVNKSKPRVVKENEREKIKKSNPRVVKKSETTSIIDPETQRRVNNRDVFSQRRYWAPENKVDYINKKKEIRERELQDTNEKKNKSLKQLCYLKCDRLYQQASMKSKRKHKKNKNTKKLSKKRKKKNKKNK